MNSQRVFSESYRLLVLGGARSGKSRYAERVAESCPTPWTYVATAEPGDKEMELKIKHHRERRSENWTTIEEPLDLANVLKSGSKNRQTILVDCLTIWVSNLIIKNIALQPEFDNFLESVLTYRGSLIMVSNEVGLGIVPDNKLGRKFRDVAGSMNQSLAEISDSVHFIVSGLPIILKENSE